MMSESRTLVVCCASVKPFMNVVTLCACFTLWALGARGTYLYRLSSVTAKPRKAPSRRNIDTHIVTGLSCTKKSCQAISKYHPICHPKPTCMREYLKMSKHCHSHCSKHMSNTSRATEVGHIGNSSHQHY